MKITVIGTGYVGLITGVALATKKFNVVCVDKRKEIVGKLSRGEPTIHESGLKGLMKKAFSKKTISFSTDLAAAMSGTDIVFVTVGTPFKGNQIDLSQIESAASEIGAVLANTKKYLVVVVKSTVVPTTTELVVKRILEEKSGKKAGKDFGLCSNPEFLREGNAVEDFLKPDRVVIGSIDDKSGKTLKKVYGWCKAPIMQTNLRTAEMIKYTSNSFFASLISFSNEIANLSAVVGGIDSREVLKGLHLDFRLSPVVNGKRVEPEVIAYLKAGCGFGGSCFPKDVSALLAFGESKRYKMRILKSVMDVNEKQPLEVVKLLKKGLKNIANKKIAVLGLAFKPGTDDVRESPAIRICKALLKADAFIRAYDPVVKEKAFKEYVDGKNISFASSVEAALKGSDAALIITSWPAFKNITPDLLRKIMNNNPVLVDARGMLSKEKFEDIGYRTIGLGVK